jgi:uncharacterized protein
MVVDVRSGSGWSVTRLQSALVMEAFVVPGLPFPMVPSEAGVWSADDEAAAVVATAPAHTDLYIDPGVSSVNVESTLNAPTLIGTPPDGDFQFIARVTVDFTEQYDAGVLLVWIDEQHWAKFCFEFSPAGDPMVVSVVTRTFSDDANAVTIDGRTLWMRVARLDHAYAFHCSTDGQRWSLVRVFTLGEALDGHQVGFEAQSPNGEGCTVSFESIRFVSERLVDLRDGS